MASQGFRLAPTYIDALASFVEDGPDLAQQIGVLKVVVEGELGLIEDAVVNSLLAARLARREELEDVRMFSFKCRRSYLKYLGFGVEEVEHHAAKGLLALDDERYRQWLGEKLKDEPCDVMVLETNFALGVAGPESFRDDLSEVEKKDAFLSGWRAGIQSDYVALALANRFFKTNRVGEALRIFERIVRGPRSFEYDIHEAPQTACFVRTLLGDMYSALSRNQEAVQQWRKVAGINSEDVEKLGRAEFSNAAEFWISSAKLRLRKGGTAF